MAGSLMHSIINNFNCFSTEDILKLLYLQRNEVLCVLLFQLKELKTMREKGPFKTFRHECAQNHAFLLVLVSQNLCHSWELLLLLPSGAALLKVSSLLLRAPSTWLFDEPLKTSFLSFHGTPSAPHYRNPAQGWQWALFTWFAPGGIVFLFFLLKLTTHKNSYRSPVKWFGSILL